jgi:hypothetical protein
MTQAQFEVSGGSGKVTLGHVDDREASAMNDSSRAPARIRRPVAGPASAPTDAADLGTAYGMEICLDQQDGPPAAAPVAVSRAPRWIQRLAARTRGQRG